MRRVNQQTCEDRKPSGMETSRIACQGYRACRCVSGVKWRPQAAVNREVVPASQACIRRSSLGKQCSDLGALVPQAHRAQAKTSICTLPSRTSARAGRRLISAWYRLLVSQSIRRLFPAAVATWVQCSCHPNSQTDLPAGAV